MSLSLISRGSKSLSFHNRWLSHICTITIINQKKNPFFLNSSPPPTPSINPLTFTSKFSHHDYFQTNRRYVSCSTLTITHCPLFSDLLISFICCYYFSPKLFPLGRFPICFNFSPIGFHFFHNIFYSTTVDIWKKMPTCPFKFSLTSYLISLATH